MKLTYRGVSYDYNPVTVETTVGEAGGKYRSRDWRFRNLKKPPVLQPRFNLKYRGVSYNIPGNVPTEAPALEKTPVLSTQDKARTLMMDRTQSIKKRQQTLLSRVSSEIGASSSAARYWNHIQGKVHPSFRATYDRYGATMS